MALEAGDAIRGTGLAGLIARYKGEAYGKKYNVKADARGVDALARAIIEYLVDNTEVVVTELPGGAPVAPPGVGNIE